MQLNPGPCPKCGGATELAFSHYHCKRNCEMGTPLVTSTNITFLLDGLRAGHTMACISCPCDSQVRGDLGPDVGRLFKVEGGALHASYTTAAVWYPNNKEGAWDDPAGWQGWADHVFEIVR